MTRSLIYTGTGDSGTTALVGGARVKKNDVRIEAYGTVDELNSHIGLVAADSALPDRMASELLFVQHRLFNIGAYLATEPSPDGLEPVYGLTGADVERLERAIDLVDAQLPRHNRFVLPGGSVESARCHIARTVCRRAERRIIDLAECAPVNPLVTRFVNRLSDFLFVLARFVNTNSGRDEIFWDKDC